MVKENTELKKLCDQINNLLTKIDLNSQDFASELLKLRAYFNSLYDVDKHYKRKEFLLFPFLEKKGITGPPKVMWGKHDEIRELIKGSIEVLKTEDITREDLLTSAEMLLSPATDGVFEMTKKEEDILLPMCLDKLSDAEWYEIDKQSIEIGFCLYDPPTKWLPEGTNTDPLTEMNRVAGNIQLPSGNFSVEELLSILNTVPLDMTFVDKNDKVRYFTQGNERIFQRNRVSLIAMLDFAIHLQVHIL